MADATKVLSPAELARYSRHILLREIGVEGQARLAGSSALVIGAGGLGSPIALYLAAAGVGTIGIAEFDRVEEHNLQPAVGAAVTGLRPVAELMFIDFIGVAFDPLLNQAAKLRYMFGGKARVPLTVRTSVGAGLRSAAQHSQSLYNLTTAIPGLKTVIPSNPGDAKGLLLAAIRDDDPVVFCEPKSLMFKTGEVAEGDYVVPLGMAAVARAGNDLSLVAFGAMVDVALDAAAALAEDGVQAEVLDLRSLQPLDEPAILATLAKTGRLIVVDEAPPRCGIASDVAALCVDAGFDSLNGPVRRVTGPHAPVPFSAVLEDAYRPTAARVVAVARELLG
jgi:pyruvate dehydrogenase E1 component beta subunit